MYKRQLLWVLAAGFTGNSVKGAWKIWRRDRRNHASPNSAQTESACAGALGCLLYTSIVLHLFIVTSLKYAEIHLAEVVYGDILGSQK